MFFPFVSGVTAQQAQEVPQPPPTGKILYVDISEPGKTYLASVKPDGTGKVRLTPPYSNIVFPKQCPKNKWLAFTNKLPNMISEVYVMDAKASKVKKLFSGASFECFSPNGKFLLYTTCDEKAELYSYGIQSKKSIQLSQDLKVSAADWSPDGEWIAVSALTEDGTMDIYMISTLAQGIERITKTPGVSESFPVFTHDGKQLAFISDRHGRSEIEFLDLEKKTIKRPIITGIYPTFSPDSSWIAFEIDNKIGISRSNGLDIAPLIDKGRTPVWVND